VSTYETMITIGMGLWIVLAGAILVGLVYTINLIRKVREPLREISNAAGELNARLQPILSNIERASEQARQIAARIQTDANEVGQTVRHASASTRNVVELVEDRVAEIAALLEVVQDEAEETFLSTASLLRGLRRGGKQVSRVKRKIGDIRRG